MVTTTEQFCRGYSELKEQYKQVCFKFVKDEGGKSFRLIDNSKTGYATLFKKQTTRMTYGKGRTAGTAFKSCSVYIVCAHC